MERGRVTANGIEFTYLENGPADGPLALCLHGFPDHAPTFTSLLEELAGAGFHAVAPWMRGYHPTGLAPDGNYQIASLALDAIALADALAGDGPAVLVGHDWGAIASYTAVAHAPTRFGRLANMAVPHAGALGQHIFEPAQLKRSWYQYFFQMALSDAVVPMNDYAIIDTLWRDWSPGLDPDPELMRELKADLRPAGVHERRHRLLPLHVRLEARRSRPRRGRGRVHGSDTGPDAVPARIRRRRDGHRDRRRGRATPVLPRRTRARDRPRHRPLPPPRGGRCS